MKRPICRIVAHKAANYADARWLWDNFCRENSREIVDCKCYDYFRTRMTNGEVHYFVPNHQWRTWSRGRTYWLYDELYHSDFKIKYN